MVSDLAIVIRPTVGPFGGFGAAQLHTLLANIVEEAVELSYTVRAEFLEELPRSQNINLLKFGHHLAGRPLHNLAWCEL